MPHHTRPLLFSSIEELAEDLEKYLRNTIVEDNGAVRRIFKKALYTQVNDLKLTVNTHDHPPDHFHVTSTQHRINARFTVDTIQLLEHSVIDRKNEKKIQAFFSSPENKRSLREFYDRLRPTINTKNYGDVHKKQ